MAAESINPPAGGERSSVPPAGAARSLRKAVGFLLGILLLPFVIWAMAALRMDAQPAWLGLTLVVAFGAGTLVVVVRAKRQLRAWVACAGGGFLLVLGWWLTLKPANDRDWQPDVAVLAHATINTNQVTLHNIRNNDYRTETDFDVRHYDQTFDLDQLRTADLFMVYWGSPNMAHTMISFGFADGGQVCFSIETRKEKGEGYSAVKGLFRQFELVYVVADERDVVKLRTNYRPGEGAYLYRLNGSPEQVRTFFLDYLRRLNSLHQQPEWYNALKHNCTTSIRMQRAAADRAPWDWRMIVNGHGDEMLYERGLIATNLPFAELKRSSHINERARAAGARDDFSALIRNATPTIESPPEARP